MPVGSQKYPVNLAVAKVMRKKKRWAQFLPEGLFGEEDYGSNKKRQDFYLPKMNTIRRSLSIFITPFPISTTTLGFSTNVFRRLKSNLEPPFSLSPLAVLFPQPILPATALGKSKFHKITPGRSTASNLHWPTNDEYKQVRLTFPPPGQPRTISFYSNLFTRKIM